MNKLTYHDLQFALMRCPKALLSIMKDKPPHIFVGGGFLRSVVAGESINDIDVFVSHSTEALWLAQSLAIRKLRLFKAKASKDAPLIPMEYGSLSGKDKSQVDRSIYTTDNAYTVTCFQPSVQIIHRWIFDTGPEVADSFDFTCCCAAFWWQDDKWRSYCDDRFYCDVASKRLIYQYPVRNEDAGGSLLRVLKYYQKGYRIPMDSLAGVIGRMMRGINFEKMSMRSDGVDEEGKPVTRVNEGQFAKVVCGLLREVDPNIDPSHIAHLPAEEANVEEPQ